jgi:hypothetical protein
MFREQIVFSVDGIGKSLQVTVAPRCFSLLVCGVESCLQVARLPTDLLDPVAHRLRIVAGVRPIHHVPA